MARSLETQTNDQSTTPSLGTSRSSRVIHQKALATIEVDDAAFPATVVEACGRDVHIVLGELIAVGTRVSVGFWSIVPTVEVRMPGIVHWVSDRAHGVSCGIALAEEVPQEFLVRHPGCQRENLRFPCRVTAQLTWADTNAFESGIVMNYSHTGFCIQLHKMPQVGAEFRLESRQLPPSHSLVAVIRWVIGQDDGCLAGCELRAGVGYSLSGIAVPSPFCD